MIAAIAIVAAASMAGLPPLLGFVAKEAVFTAFLEAAPAGERVGWIALVGVVARLGAHRRLHAALRLGRVLHARRGVEPDASCTARALASRVAPGLLARREPRGSAFALGVDRAAARRLRRRAARAARPYHLALWHGLEPALG